MKPIIITIILASGIYTGLTAQTIAYQKEIPIKISLLNERVSMPTFNHLFSDWNLGAAAGTEFLYKRKPHFQFFQTAEIGFYTHQKLGTTGMLYSELGVRGIWKSLQADFSIGPGYLLNYAYMPLYKEQEGVYKMASQLQNKFMLKSSVTLGYRIHNIAPFIAYSYSLETPFINSRSSLLPHQFAEAGVKCYLISANQKH